MTPTVQVLSDTVQTALELRRRIHAHPELRFAEHATAALIADRLRDLGYEVQAGLGGTGVLATRAGGPGRHVVLRAELDALPVSDRKAVPYASTVAGVCHACGHDAHMAIIAGVAEEMGRTGIPAGRVSLLFQPAEERPFGEPSGAQAILDSGVLARWPVDAMLALHAWPDLPAGTVGLDSRIAMAGKFAFRISLAGAGSHAASPHLGRDAILAAAATISALHHIVSRQVGADERAVINVGTIRGGRSQSIVSEEAELTGTIRWLEEAVGERLKRSVEEKVAGIARSYDVEPSIEWASEMPPVRNDPRLTDLAAQWLADLLGDRFVPLNASPLTTDDFALYAERLPSLYLKLGSCSGDVCAPLHSGAFDVDDAAIDTGITSLTHLVLRLLAQPIVDEGGPRTGGETDPT